MTTDGCADLVLEGGGVKGIALVGAIAEMEARGHRFGAPARIAGTSAGAIVGSLLTTLGLHRGDALAPLDRRAAP